jgi:hypothetical protein
MLKVSGLIIALIFVAFAAHAKHDSDHPLSPEDWEMVMEKVVLLEGSGLMPTLLPVIMGNQDTLQLTDEQVSAFTAWRKENYTKVINLMNKILEKKVLFRVEALSPGTTGERLVELQSEIQELQRELMKLKLTCRKLVVTTFTEEQWENFSFVVSDNPRLASLLSQAGTLDSGHLH